MIDANDAILLGFLGFIGLLLLALLTAVIQSRGEIGAVRGEIGEVRGEIGEVRGEIGEIRGEIAEMKGMLRLVLSHRHVEDTGEVLLTPEQATAD